MKFIKEYKEFNELDILSDKSIDLLDNEIIMSLLFKYRNKEIGDKLWKIINKFKVNKDWGTYNTPDEWFEDKEYKTFMQYFKRKLSKDKFDEIKSQKNNMSLPCECNIESIGKISDTSSIIRLKKSAENVINDLKNIGLKNVDDLSFINMKLLKVYYHRVHSPISGKIKDIIEVSPDDNFFGENNLWIIEISTVEFGNVYLILVGELSIQDFTFKVKKGDNINMFEEVGNFNWASQVIILYDKGKFNDIKIKSDKKYFIGEPIF
jgi:phosphatidylserine decarboxylase